MPLIISVATDPTAPEWAIMGPMGRYLPTKSLFDMHCHLGFIDDAEVALRPAGEDGPAALSCTLTPEEFEQDRFRLAPWPRCRVALGLHPWTVADGTMAATAVEAFEELAPTVSFIGEVGLDFGGARGEEARRRVQQEAFARVLAACDHVAPCGIIESKLLSIHAVRAADRVLAMLDEQGTLQRHSCIFHWFAGSSIELSRAIEAGCWFSVGPRMLATKRCRYSTILSSWDSRDAVSAMRSMSEECSATQNSAFFSWSNFSGRPVS